MPRAVAEASRGAEDDWQVVVKALEGFYEVRGGSPRVCTVVAGLTMDARCRMWFLIPKTPLGVDVAALPPTESDDARRTSPAFVRLLELVLGVVVQSEEKAAFVQDILGMDASVQVDLMAAIEKVMAHGAGTPAVASSQAVDDEGGGDHGVPPSTSVSEARSPHPRSTASTPGFQSPLHLSTNADLDRVKRENAILRDENVGAPCGPAASTAGDSRGLCSCCC